MATISSPGVGSGLDVNSIVTQLVAIERQPIDKLQAQAATIQTKLSSFGLLQSYTANISDIAARLAKPEFWTSTAASSSDTTAVGISFGATAAAGSYAVSVTQLAQAQSLASKAYAASTTTAGSGTLRIELGEWDTGLTAFTADGTKTPVNISVLAGDSLDAIKTKVNAANAGVTASVVTDASGARLVFTSTATGAKSAVRITATDDDGVNTDATGLSALAFDPPTAAGQMTQSQAAKNATATINGLAITSSTNRIEGAIAGVTLNLNKVTTSPVNVQVSLDSAALKKAVTDFAKAYSDIASYISQQTKFDPATKRAAALQGDRSTLTLQASLRSIYLDNSTASAAFSRLSDIGVELQTDGTLKVNDTKLNAAMANPAEVAKLFSATGGATSQGNGYAVRVKEAAAKLLGTDGVISMHTKGLRDSIKRNEKQQEAYETRVEMTKARLLKQYAALDKTVSQIKGAGSSLSQSLEMLTAQTKNLYK
jgi:flagellar hook-associated protein 2